MSTRTHNQPRQPRGVPVGGQWKAMGRAEGPALVDDIFTAASWGQLPPDFDRWDLADNDGRTVAHEAAQHGHLPPDFDRWDLADNDGYTVAHVAAESGHLPSGFDRWDLADKRGRTVADVVAEQVARRP